MQYSQIYLKQTNDFQNNYFVSQMALWSLS